MWKRAVAASIASAAAGLSACASQPNLKPLDETLAPCDAPSCVSSQMPGTDFYIAPLTYPGDPNAARIALLKLLKDLPTAEIEESRIDYIHVKFTTPTMRYVDDLELRFAKEERVIHVRSAPRFGFYDLAENRKRVELLRQQFEAIQP